MNADLAAYRNSVSRDANPERVQRSYPEKAFEVTRDGQLFSAWVDVDGSCFFLAGTRFICRGYLLAQTAVLAMRQLRLEAK